MSNYSSKRNMSFVYKMNVVWTRSPFETARSEVDGSEAMLAEIIYNKLDYMIRKSMTTEITFILFLIDQDANGIFYKV